MTANVAAVAILSVFVRNLSVNVTPRISPNGADEPRQLPV
jgi:hypothetical protein